MTEVQARKAVHIIVHGFVQGVGFRYFTQKIAQRLGVVGWVKNRHDETVEIWAEDHEGTLQQFIAFIKEGPAHSQVEQLELQWAPASGKYQNFYIQYL